MIPVLAALIIAGFASNRDDCNSDVSLFVAERARRVYVDPSEETQKSVTREIEGNVLPVLRRGVSRGDIRSADCASRIFPEIAGFGHVPALSAALDSNTSPWGSLSARRILRRRVAAGSHVVLPTPERQALERRCMDLRARHWFGCEDWFDEQVSGGNLSVRPVLEQRLREQSSSNDDELKAQVAWLNLLDRTPDREERLRLALHQSGADGKGRHLRDRALDSMIGDVDARKWAVGDLALALSFGKRRDEAVLDERRKRASEGRARPRGLGTTDGHTYDDPELRDLLLRLRPMGLRNAFELIGVKSIVVAGINAPSTDSILDGDATFPTWEHFRGERVLYADDWFRTASSSGETSAKHKERRWQETDAAAPTPDLNAVREALRVIESKQTWVGGRAGTR